MPRCEALVLTEGVSRKQMYVPCGTDNADLHHKVTRARGGLILDEAGETYHHMRLCRYHHGLAHDEGWAYERGLLIRGSVVSGINGPIYTGPDSYLSKKYGVE